MLLMFCEDSVLVKLL